jgi:hypothetical protein
MNCILRLAVVAAVVCVLAGCVGAGRVVPVGSSSALEPEATFELGSAAAAICRDGDGLLVLENSGTRIIRLVTGDGRPETVPQETLPLVERVTSPVGILADRFYIYVYDDHVLYRMSKEKLDLAAWVGNVRVAGLASFEPGTMLLSDADRGAIWYKGLFGERGQFISAAEIARPGAMVALADGSFAVLSAASRLVFFFNRSGVVTRTYSLPAACDLLAEDGHGSLCIGQRGKPQMWVLKNGHQTGHRLPDSASPLCFAVVKGRLAVLDAGTRVSLYPLPESE